jgi:putative transposase
MAETIRFQRRHLPHWEVKEGRYFVTIRSADSLPREAVLRLGEIAETLGTIAPESAQFAKLQRESFQTLEKYLDAGLGVCPFKQPTAARVIVDELNALAEWQVAVPHDTIMPNHCHVMLVPGTQCRHSLSEIMKRLKGRSARRLRQLLGGSGPIWQREWFDRWMRDDCEWEKCVADIRNNPVKAGFVSAWPMHAWTK